MSLFSGGGGYGAGSSMGIAAASPSAGQGSQSAANGSGWGVIVPPAAQQQINGIVNADVFRSNLNNAYQSGMLNNAGTIQGLQLQSNLGGATLLNYGQQYDDQQQQYQQTYDNNVMSNNLNALGNLAQQAAIPRQIDYTNNSYANQVGRYQDQTGYIGQERGFNDTDLAQTQGYLGTSGTLADQLMGIQNTGAGITQGDALRNARYATEASGGGATARAYGENMQSAKDVYANTLAGNQNTNASTHNSLDYQGQQAQLGHDKTSADLTDQQSGLNHGIWQSALDTGEKNAQSNDQLGQLKLAGAQLGINATQLQQGLDHALTQLNLSRQLTAGQILTDLGSNNAQRQQLAAQILQRAIASANGK